MGAALGAARGAADAAGAPEAAARRRASSSLEMLTVFSPNLPAFFVTSENSMSDCGARERSVP